MKYYRNTLHRVLIVITFFFACIAGPVNADTDDSAHLSASDYLQLTQTAEGFQKQLYLLFAANRYVRNRDMANAQLTLNKIDASAVTPAFTVKQKILQSNVWILNSQYQQAADSLNELLHSNLPLTSADQIAIYQLAAFAYQKMGNIAASIQQRSQLLPIINGDNRDATLKQIWQSVQSLDKNGLTQLINNAGSPDVAGWASLALIVQTYNNNSNALTENLQRWRSQYPNHPANALLTNVNAQSQAALPAPNAAITRVALLLPLSGPLASTGGAIRNGFLTAYDLQKKLNSAAPEVTVYDTQGKNVVAVYQQAINEGADAVVGPLTKDNVSQLASSGAIKVQTLVLNSLADGQKNNNPNLYLFGLSPIDEATQVAQKAWSDHHGTALIITPNNAWGKPIVDTFTQAWQQLGGKVVAQMYYDNQAVLANQISATLGIDASNQRAKELKQILGQKFRFMPRRRDDADMIFVVAQPDMARQIRPLLRYYFAGDIAIYSTSQIFTGAVNPSYNRDLDGIVFPDMPWVLSQNKMQPDYLSTIQNNIKATWPDAYAQQPKLFALGVDAYDLVLNLPKLAVMQQFGTPAATGIIFLDSNQHLYRKLEWAQMSDGEPVLIQ